MLQAASEEKFSAVESGLRRAAHHHDATILSVTHVGQHPRESKTPDDAFVFCLWAQELYAALLDADIRMSAFLPCRIAAYTNESGVALEAMSPLDFCRLLNRPDLAPLALPLEDLVRSILDEAAKPSAAVVQGAAGKHHGGLGATEEQMSLRGAIPQRIDQRGTKVEELGGTGEHDAQGG